MSHDENPYQSPSTTNKTPKKARHAWAELETVIVAWCVVAMLVWLGLPFLDTVLSLFLPLYLLLFLPCLAGALFLMLRYIWWPSLLNQGSTKGKRQYRK